MPQRLIVPALGLLACSAAAALAQTATVPSNYHGPNVVGACWYTQSNTAFYAFPIQISNYFRIDAERSFHKFVQTSTGQGLPATCRWLTEQQYAATQDKSFNARNSAGQPMPATRLNWQYVPGSGGINATTATSAPPAGNTAAPAARTAASAATAGSSQAAATPANTPGTTTSSTIGSTGTGIGSSVTDSVNSSKQAITASGATAVTDTMSSATTAVTGAMQSGMTHLFHHGKKAADTSAATAARPSPDPATAAPANSFAVTADTPATAAPAGGPTFVFCHLVASGSEYVSDIFPTTDASDSTAQTAFWRQVGHQYKLSSIPFTNNVTCARSTSEAGATSARQTLMASAPTKGLKIVDTQWTWMGTGQ